MDRNLTRVVGTLAVSALVIACTSGSTGPTVDAPVPAPTTVDTTLIGDFDVGGRTMHLVCLGPLDTGRPTIIFEAGLGGEFQVWGDVLTQVSATDRGCSYDRAGVGLSESGPSPRTTADQVDDLRALLDAAEVTGPYVLVGHSSGAYNVLVHADRHPDDVAGAVLVDPRPPEASSRFLAALPAEESGEPDVIRQYREGYTSWEQDPTRNAEGLALADSATEVMAAGGFGDRPLIVLAAADTSNGEGADLDPTLAASFQSIWWELQAGLATRSTSGRLERVEDSTHDMPYERPDAILHAIEEVLATTGS